MRTLHLLDEHLIGIGYIAIRAGQLDAHIERTIDDTTPQFPASIAKMLVALSVPKKIDLIGEWLKTDLTQRKREISEFISTIHATRSERDDVVHRTWERTDAADEKLLVDRRGGKVTPKRKVTAKYLLGLADRLLELALKLDEWRDDAFSALLEAQYSTSPGILLRPTWPPNFSAMSNATLLAVLARTTEKNRQPGS